MKQIIIENPILNSPFVEPQRHFKFTDEGITDEVVAARRTSAYFIPVPQSKKKSKTQASFLNEWTAYLLVYMLYDKRLWVLLSLCHCR